MGRKQQSKTPQPEQGPRVQGVKTPKSAPVGQKSKAKKGGNEVSTKAVVTKLFQNGGATPGKGKSTPKVGDKRKLDNSLPIQTPGKGNKKAKDSKPNTPATVLAKGKPTPVKTPKAQQLVKAQTPKGKKTPQAKTPQVKMPAKGKQKTPQKPASDDEDDEDDDDDMEDIDFDMDSDDDDDLGESFEEDMDDDDDDDDDEEDDSEEAPSPKKASAGAGKKGAKLVPVQPDDDDDEEDDEDDEDDDEDDDDDVDEEAILKNIQAIRKTTQKADQKQKQADVKAQQKQKQQADTKAQQKQKQQADLKAQQQKQKQTTASKQKQDAAEKTQKKPQQQTEEAVMAAPDDSGDSKRKDDRDRCTLFVKNLTDGGSVKEIKALSDDIKEVRLRITVRGKRHNKKKMGYAFLEFASEALADKNYKLLQGAKIKGSEVVVDYVGKKSTFVSDRPKKEAADPDPLRLYITGFSSETKEAELYKLFPKAQEINMPLRRKDSKSVGYAFAAFATAEQCKAAHEKCQGAKIQGDSLVVLYAKKRSVEQKKKDAKSQQRKEQENEKKSQPPAKKAKLEVKAKEEEEDDDDDDDDDEDDDDDSEDGDAAGSDDDDDDEEDDDDDDDDDDNDDDDDDDDDDE